MRWALKAPYAWTSLPVLLGTAGGIGLLIGPAGLWWLNARRHPAHGDAAQRPMDRAFIALLFLTSLTGLACCCGARPRRWRCCWPCTWAW